MFLARAPSHFFPKCVPFLRMKHQSCSLCQGELGSRKRVSRNMLKETSGMIDEQPSTAHINNLDLLAPRASFIGHRDLSEKVAFSLSSHPPMPSTALRSIGFRHQGPKNQRKAMPSPGLPAQARGKPNEAMPKVQMNRQTPNGHR